MKHLVSTLFIAGSLGLATAAHAQRSVSIGPKLGANLANRHVPQGTDAGYRFGVVAGAQASLSWGKFALQPALLFSQKGSSDSQEVNAITNGNSQTGTYTVKFQLNYLTLPLNFTFAPKGPSTGPQIFAGPYVGMLLGGNISESFAGREVGTYPLAVATEVDPTTGTYASRRFDAGFQAGVGYRFERLVLQAEYSLGLLTHAPTYVNSPFGTPEIYNRSFQASVSYLFDLTR